MRCPIETPESAELLLAYCSRKLDGESAAVLENHIAVCPACREFAEVQRAVWSALDSWEAAPVSPDFDRRLYRRIEKEVSWWDLIVRPFRPMSWRYGLPITAAAALVITAGILLQPPSGLPSRMPDGIQLEAVEQAEHTLETMEAIHEFSKFVRPDGPTM